ncbi:hypothetical protein TZ02_18810 [Clostridium aceticum]|nr:hypothetical protein TZ02_18810 [Clostridium aceticum]
MGWKYEKKVYRKKILGFILILCIAIVWLYITLDLMIDRWGSLAIGTFINFAIISFFVFIDYIYKYNIRK